MRDEAKQWDDWASFYRDHLVEQVMRPWAQHTPDPAGGLWNSFDRFWRPTDNRKNIWCQGRMLYMFATLYGELEARAVWLERAAQARQFLLERARSADGSFAYLVGQDGTILDATASRFTDIFVVMGLAAYAHAADTTEDAALIESLYAGIESTLLRDDYSVWHHFSFDQDHLWHGPWMAAMGMIPLARSVLGADRVEKLADLALQRLLYVFAKDECRMLLESLRPDGTMATDEKAQWTNPGHALESAWFCMEEALYRRSSKHQARAVEVCRWACEKGWDDRFGGLLAFVDPAGRQPPGPESDPWGERWDHKIWWVHSEALYATLLAASITGDAAYWRWFKKLHDYTFAHFPDESFGGWYEYLDRHSAEPISFDKSTGVKCAFHIPRALLKCYLLLDRWTKLEARESSLYQIAPEERMALFFGMSQCNITPTVPVGLSGYFNVRMWDHVLDDLCAQAAVFRNESTVLALVQLDLVGVPERLVAQVRQRLSDVSAQLPSQNILITCTHTHTAPAVQEEEAGSSRAYIESLADHIAQIVREALEPSNQRCVALQFDRAWGNTRLAFCRRYWVRNHGVVTNPPAQMRPDLLAWEGPVDDESGVLSVWHDQELLAVLPNIVNHTDTIGWTGVSGDWPGLLRPALRDRLNAPDLFVMPLIGCSGDAVHINAFRDSEWFGYSTTQALAQGYARQIAEAVVPTPEKRSDALSLTRTLFEASPRQLSEQDIAEARRDVQRYAEAGTAAGEDLTAFDLATRKPAALKWFAEGVLRVAADRQPRRYEVFAAQLGDCLLVSMPGEPFVSFQLKVKHQYLQGRPCLVVSHGNALADYIAMDHHYKNGGYEIEPAVSWLSVDTGDRMLEAVHDALVKIDAIPCKDTMHDG